MKKQFSMVERKVFYQYIQSYVLILLLPTILIFASFRIITSQQIKNEEANMEQLLGNNVQLMQTNMDEYIQRCQAINYVLLQNSKLYYLLKYTNAYSSDNISQIYYVSEDIKSLCLTNSFVQDIVICMAQNGININQYGKISTEDVYTQYIKQENGGFTYREWLAEMADNTGGKILSMEDGSLYFLRSYPVTSIGAGNDCIVLIKFKSGVITDKFAGIKTIADSTVGIIDDSTGENILNLFKNKNFDETGLGLNDPSGYIIHNGYLLSYLKSRQLPVTYISAIPQKILLDHEQRLSIFTVIAFSVWLFLGFILIIFTSKKKSNPVRQLLALADTGTHRTSTFLDPYSEVKSVLLDAADQELAYTNQQKDNERRERERTFLAILYNKKSTIELIQQNADSIGLLYASNQSCFIKLKCIDISSCFGNINDHGKINCTPVQFCATIISQVLSEHYTVTSIPYGQEAFIIITVKDEEIELFLRDIKSHLQQSQRLFQESYGIDTLIAISDFHSGIKGIKTAFKESNQIIEYMEFAGNTNFGEYSTYSLLKKRNEFTLTSHKDENEILTYINSGEFTKAKESFNNIINVYFDKMPVTPQTSKLRLYAFVSKILEAVNSNALMDVSGLIEEYSDQGQFLNFDSVAEFKNSINSFFDALEASHKNAEGEEKTLFIQNIYDIIAHNYMNPDLNVSMVANLLNKNLDYVSRTYKKITGNGLLESIQKFRIDKAKSYLDDNPDLTVQQIAAMVGYVSSESFIRVFKHNEEVTPGRYKTMIRKNK